MRNLKEKIKKSNIFLTLLIILSLIGTICIIKPIILSVFNIDNISIFNLNKLASAITQTATNTTPAVTNGGSGGTSSGGSGIKSIQHKIITCASNGAAGTQYVPTNPIAYDINPVNPEKTQLTVTEGGVTLDYTLTNNKLTLNNWTMVRQSRNSDDDYYYSAYYYCRKIVGTSASTIMGPVRVTTLETDAMVRYITIPVTVTLTEYY